ncbi:MAG: gliding motility-associated C-terminal domain-containing protein [Chitinophagales bacterium]|nr:gliding motility-associated C-terminal domain-containing protein [Chitinophagales bacterium]
MKKLLTLFFLFQVMISSTYATHNRAGEITYKQISGLTFEFTITTYTKASSVDADRSDLTIFWGDGTSNLLPRTTEQLLSNDIKLNRYTGTHTYSGPFTYVVYMIDPNRIESILNISNSVNVPFYIEDTLKILDPLIYGFNNSPVLLNPPIDFGNVNEIFVHNPNAYDPDGDSLSYRFIAPKQGVGMNVPGYVSPDKISPGPDNVMTLNPYTGELLWKTPKKQGIYNVAILITEYRNGQVIGTVTRDLQIIVQAALNKPPQIQGPQQICVVAGDTIRQLYTASDSNIHQVIKLTSNGAPYEVLTNKAVFNTTEPKNPNQAEFYWATSCNHLRNTNYQMVVKAEDNAEVPLVDLKTVVIKVLAPAPKITSGEYFSTENQVKITWEYNYPCAANDKFIGFSIWRKMGCSFEVDSCGMDLSLLGYTKIGETTEGEWIDTQLKRGVNYSYVVVAEFASKSQIGMLYNKFQGIPSEEMCVELPKNIPLFYHVDVKVTDIVNGQIYIEWSKPHSMALDTLKNPGPYKIKLLRATDNDPNFQQIFEMNASQYSALWDTVYTDILLNTAVHFYNYKLEFYVNGNDLLGESLIASSVFLSIKPSNQTLELIWTSSVPWQNDEYFIYKKDFQGNFNLVDSTDQTTYIDNNLSNDSIYCYKIKSKGSYHIEGLKSPLINYSQIVCAQPKDTMPPCAPILEVENYCTHQKYSKEEAINYLKWVFPRNCLDSNALKYLIYFKENISGDYQLIDSVIGATHKEYKHFLESSLRGCYQIRAVDEDENISQGSNEICVSDCPIYELPNSFTPNGDGINDFYTPILPFSGVNRINMHIYNKMGNLVFETTSPDILWNGTDFKNGKELPSGVYYYVCEVYFQTLDGESKLEKPLSGYIHLIR